MKTILVVCKGNIFRSPVAEFLLNKKIDELGLRGEVSCLSRGIQGSKGVSPPKYPKLEMYEEEFRLARPVLEKYRIDIRDHVSRPVDQETLTDADLILVMDWEVMSNPEGGICTYGNDIVEKACLIDPGGVFDPAETGVENRYELVVKAITEAVDDFEPSLMELAGGKEGGKLCGKERDI